MPRPTQRNGAETRERILEVACELFTDLGYDKASLRDIAARLDITKAALYYYFARKDDILVVTPETESMSVEYLGHLLVGARA